VQNLFNCALQGNMIHYTWGSCDERSSRRGRSQLKHHHSSPWIRGGCLSPTCRTSRRQGVACCLGVRCASHDHDVSHAEARAKEPMVGSRKTIWHTSKRYGEPNEGLKLNHSEEIGIARLQSCQHSYSCFSSSASFQQNSRK
jgi:hypothetical protein